MKHVVQRSWLLSTSLAGCLACDRPSADSRDRVEPDWRTAQVSDSIALKASGRAPSKLALRELWRRPIYFNDTLLLQPGRLAAKHGVLFVSDFASQRVVGLDAATGRAKWVAGRRGAGPREFMGRLRFVGDAEDRVTVLDPVLRRTTVVHANGRIDDPQPLPLKGSFLSSCQAPAGDLLLTTLSSRGARLLWIRQDSIIADAPVPWREIEAGPAILAQTVAHSLGPYGCLIAPVYGPEAAIAVGPNQAVRPVKFVESVPTASARTIKYKRGERHSIAPGARSTVLSATQNGRTMFAAFSGSSALRGRVVDTYRLPEFEYSGSFVLPDRVIALSSAGNRLFAILENSHGDYFIVGWLTDK